jgi:integrase/recombinase XerD
VDTSWNPEPFPGPAFRRAFLAAAEQAERRTRTLCFCLAYTGCRISEALALTADRVDLAAGVIVFESLKKRRRGVYRAVPVPAAVLDALDLVHGLREAQKGKDDRPSASRPGT